MSRPEERVESVLELPEAGAEQVPPCQAEGAEPDQVLEEQDRAALEAVEAGPPELRPLLRYLQVTPETFARDEARYFGALGGHLRRHGIVAEGAAVDRTTYRDAVRSFQRARGLEADGIPGETVCWELQREWSEARALTIERVEADRVSGSGGFDRSHVRSDVADAYRAMRRDVLAEGGVVTSAGGFRALGATVSPGRSRTSMHYSGLALDLATDTGMRDPAKDPYVVTRDGRRWRVWCRSSSAPPRQLDAVVWSGGATEVRPVTVNAFDFTEVAERYGFARIGSRSCFPGTYLCAEWWHFQYELALVPWLSQFGVELLALTSVRSGGAAVVYDEEHLAAYDLWQDAKRLYQRGRDGWW